MCRSSGPFTARRVRLLNLGSYLLHAAYILTSLLAPWPRLVLIFLSDSGPAGSRCPTTFGARPPDLFGPFFLCAVGARPQRSFQKQAAKRGHAKLNDKSKTPQGQQFQHMSNVQLEKNNTLHVPIGHQDDWVATFPYSERGANTEEVETILGTLVEPGPQRNMKVDGSGKRNKPTGAL